MNKPLKFSSAKTRLWWCSDLHLGHNPKWEGTPPLWQSRGFKSIDDHDEWVFTKWSEMIGPDDIVFNLGDPTFADPEGKRFERLSRLPGRQMLVNGNHWSGQKQVYESLALSTVFGGAELNVPGDPSAPFRFYPAKVNNLTFVGDTLHVYVDGVSVYMQHYPCFVWPELSKNGLHIHGHCHRRLPESNPECLTAGKVLDCGVDNAIAYNGTPLFSWDEIRRIMARKPVVKRDHH